MKISKELARYTDLCQFSDLPPSVVHEAKRSILNYLAVCVAAYNDPAIFKAYEIFRSYSGKPQSTVFGFQEKLDVLQASSLNAMAANVFDFDDTHLPTIIHPTGPVVSPLFALSEQQIVSGKDFLLSAILGIEFECRLGQAISPFITVVAGISPQLVALLVLPLVLVSFSNSTKINCFGRLVMLPHRLVDS